MTDSVRERLIAAILTATGGKYALESPMDVSELPVTVVQDGNDSAETNYDFTRCVMPVSVARAEQASSPVSDVQRLQAHAALQNLIELMHADETFGGLAQGIDYVGGGIQIDAGKLIFAEATFQVRYQHLRGQPAVLN